MSSARRLCASALLAATPLVAVACQDPTTVLPDDAEIRVVNPVAWPAAELVLVSTAFRDFPELPQVQLDAESLLVTRQNDSTVLARLPDSSGTFALTVRLHGGTRFGTVRTVGLVAERLAPPAAGWPLALTPGSPIVMAVGESTIVRINMMTGAGTVLPIRHSNWCTLSVGPSYDDGAVVAQDIVTGTTNCTRALHWQLRAAPAPADSAPLAASADRMWAELSPGIWLRLGRHRVTIYGPSAPGGDTLQIEEAQRLVFSPDRSTVALLAEFATGGVPVLNSATGTVRFRLPGGAAYSAAFSPTGDTLFWAAGTTRRLVATSTASGTELLASGDSIPLYMYSMALDHLGPWLYLTNGDEVQVFDRHTLARIARLSVPLDVVCCGQFTLGIEPVARRLYLLGVQGWVDPGPWGDSRIYEYELPPVQQQAVVLSH